MELSEPGRVGSDPRAVQSRGPSEPAPAGRDPAAPDPAALARDRELVRAVLGGDRLAGERLAERLACVPRLLAVLNRRRGSRLSPHDLEDLAQDALLGIWKKLGSYHGEATLEGWLHRFCFLELMNRTRLLSRRPEAAAGFLETLPAAEGARADLEREELERGLEALGPPDADVVRLKHFDELTFEGVGRVLDITTKMAKTRYYRGIAWLQRELGARLRERNA